MRKRMPSWICLAVEEQCVEWPAATAAELTLSPDAARELQSQLSEVRNSDRAALQRRLRMLVCDRESGVFFVSEAVGSSVVVQSLDSDPGGHAKLISCSPPPSTVPRPPRPTSVRYTLTGQDAVVDGARILNAASWIAPEDVRTRSQTAQHGVELGRPELEAAELVRWREELRRSREAERASTARAEAAEATAARSEADAARANAKALTSQQYGRQCELQRDHAQNELRKTVDAFDETHSSLKLSFSDKAKEFNSKIKELERELAETKAQLYRAVHSRIETESHAAGRIETAESKAESTVEELKRQMTSAVEDARAGTIDRMATLSGLADVLCPENAIVNMNSIDSLPMSDAATNEKSRRRGDYARVTSELCCALVQFAAGGDEARVKQLVEDVPQQLSWRRLFNGDFGASDYQLRRSKHCELVFKNVIGAYRVGKAIGNYQLSKQMLSLAVVRERGGLNQSELCHEATRRRELNLLDDVRVLSATRTSAPSSSTGRSRASRSWRDAVLVAMDGETYTVMPKVVGARGRLTIDFQASQ